MPRPQFTLRAVLAVGAFFGGMAVQRKLDKPTITRSCDSDYYWEDLTMPDGTTWQRAIKVPIEKLKK